jgi:hypothetical protein
MLRAVMPDRGALLRRGPSGCQNHGKRRQRQLPGCGFHEIAPEMVVDALIAPQQHGSNCFVPGHWTFMVRSRCRHEEPPPSCL